MVARTQSWATWGRKKITSRATDLLPLVALRPGRSKPRPDHPFPTVHQLRDPAWFKALAIGFGQQGVGLGVVGDLPFSGVVRERLAGQPDRDGA